MTSQPMEIGRVVAIKGSKVTGVLSYASAQPANSELSQAVQIGGLVRIATPRSMVFGLISSLTIMDPSTPPSADDTREVEVDLMGEALNFDDAGHFTFQRGISVYPSLGAAILTTTTKDLAQVYARPRQANVRIGSLRQDSTLPAYVSTDDLLGKHFAIMGNTGTGKSCGVTTILRSVLQAHPAGHAVLLDPHDEYARAFGEMAEKITTNDLQLPYWLLNFEEIVETLCSPDEVSREVEAAILKDAILEAKRDYLKEIKSAAPITVDTPSPYRLERLNEVLQNQAGKLNKPESARPYLRLQSRLEGLRRDRRFGFMFSLGLSQDIMGKLLSRILRIPVGGKPITIFSLSGVPSEIVDVVVSLLCRLIFDFALWGNRDSAVPILLVCEEAHRYAPHDRSVGFGPTRRAISRIAKEGRKYGVSLGMVTQRPSEISEEILSQANTIFAMRLSNDKDQQFVLHALPENAAGLLGALPALRTQEAIVVGEGVNLPMVIRFDDLEDVLRPQSSLKRVSESWQEDDRGSEYVDEIVERWRRQGF